ncbi:hypothetical protein [Bifidobacterium callimiconis]|uniref:Uncharacterized protein n=1 Tax=Bifidobacterium callimiconis TaxID=2306973 RepID=A0A430FC03_9BIFI|nr:hypothetical protein [Bifidobacterium callimiconis]MBT1177694.1 hypothetical protein [Bifidobacterium callimiconis]RSX50369.1 hypothetical protein D2E23_1692 [Bifidobacterium callimiconis]
MEINAKQPDAGHYVTNVQRAGDSITWEDRGNNYTLFLRAGFGKSVEFEGELFDQFVAKCQDDQTWQSLLMGMEVRVTPDVTAVMVSRGVVNIKSYRIPVAHAVYAAYACDLQQNVMDVYLPNEYYVYRCEVPAIVNVSVGQQTVTETKGFLFSKHTETRVVGYTVRVQPIPGYDGTGLGYTFDGCPYIYPITRDLLGKPFTVALYTAPNGTQPPLKVVPMGSGYEINAA